MNKKAIIQLLVILWCMLPSILHAQDRFVTLENQLEAMSVEEGALDEKVDISVNGVSVQEFIRGIANNVNLNINVDPGLKILIINNFSQVKVRDVLLFLCKKYQLDIQFIGNILSIVPFDQPKEEVVIKPQHIPIVEFELATELTSFDFYNDTLDDVCKEIIRKTAKNIVLAPGISKQIVSVYIQKMPFDNVVQKFAFANNLVINKTEDGFYLVDKLKESQKEQTSNDLMSNKKGNKKNNYSPSTITNNQDYDIQINDSGIINVYAPKAPLYDIIKYIADQMDMNYFMVSKIDGETDINIKGADFDKFLSVVLDGTSYTYVNQDGIYLIGESKNTALITSEVLELQYRTVSKIKEILPKELSDGIEIIEVSELNSLILTGTLVKVNELKHFIREIDKIVPVILIEIIMVDVKKFYSFSTGISAGIKKQNSSGQDDATILGSNTTNGSTTVDNKLFPTIDYTMTSDAINQLVEGVNGFGWVNLGKVNSDFYMNIKAMESNGVIKLRSTPKLSTLSGHEASLSIGETTYYKEQRSDYYGTQNPSLSNSYTWKSVNADLAVNIKPIVSGDGQITLEIDVQVQEFTKAVEVGAPPGTTNSNFKSMIRVKDQEMILLGGLEKITKVNKGEGVPFLSRIPILKWIFSSREKSKTNDKLNIFIKPTIIY